MSYKKYEMKPGKHTHVFTPLKNKGNITRVNGKKMYVPYEKGQNALMYIIEYYLDHILNNKALGCMGLRYILPHGKGEFTDRSMLKVTPEMQKCGFVGETSTGWDARKHDSRINNIRIDFADERNQKLIENYIELYRINDAFNLTVVDEEGNKKDSPKVYKFDSQAVEDAVYKKLMTMNISEIYKATVDLSDYREKIVGNIIYRMTYSTSKYSNFNLLTKLYMYFNREEWTSTNLDLNYTSEDAIFPKDFKVDMLFPIMVKFLIASKCASGTSYGIEIPTEYKYGTTQINLANKDHHIPALKGMVMMLKSVIEKFENMDIDSAFPQDKVEQTTKDMITMIERHTGDFDYREKLGRSSLGSIFNGDNKDQLDKVINKVEQALTNLGYDDDKLKEVKENLKLSLKIQQVA